MNMDVVPLISCVACMLFAFFVVELLGLWDRGHGHSVKVSLFAVAAVICMLGLSSLVAGLPVALVVTSIAGTLFGSAVALLHCWHLRNRHLAKLGETCQVREEPKY